MARNTYAPETRTAIIEAAKQARAAGKPWDEALAAAKAVGYSGTADGIEQMLRRLAGGKKTAVRRVKQPKTAKQSRKPAKVSKKAASGAKRYDEATKTAIINAATDARAAGKTWAEAFSAAKKAGYTGSLQGISKMIENEQKKAEKAKRGLGRPKTKIAAKRGPGRPLMLKAKRGPGLPPKAKQVEISGLSGVEAVIEQVVNERLNAAIDQAIAVLEQAKGE